MPFFSKQKLFCQVCGVLMETDFQRWGGRVCSEDCWEELQWRKNLCVMGLPYQPKIKEVAGRPVHARVRVEEAVPKVIEPQEERGIVMYLTREEVDSLRDTFVFVVSNTCWECEREKGEVKECPLRSWLVKLEILKRFTEEELPCANHSK